jgi:hypothetical protein
MPAAKGARPWNYGTSKGWIDARGYRWLWTVDRNGRRVKRREHRVVMEQHIGRLLEPWEVVHHKDGNPANNSVDNLEIVEFGAHTAHHHNGSRRDKDARRSIEAFALMRGELERLRVINAELYEALVSYVTYHEHIANEGAEVNEGAIASVKAHAALAKARGEKP